MPTASRLLLSVTFALLVGCNGAPPSPGPTADPPAIVTSPADSGTGSLRQALSDAKDGGTVRLSQSGTVALQAPLVLDKKVTIEAAPGTTVVLDGGGARRLLEVKAGADVTLIGLTLQNGRAPAETAQPLGATSARPFVDVGLTAGGLLRNAGTLRLQGADFKNGEANVGGAVANLAGATLTVSGGTFSGNRAVANSGGAGGEGGAIYNEGTLRIDGATIEGNTAAKRGGGVFNALGATFERTAGVLNGNAPDDAFTTTPTNASADFVYPAAWTTGGPASGAPGGAFRRGYVSDFLTLNPFTNSAADSLPGFLQVGGLLREDPTTNAFVPHMAESYTLSPDGRTWTFRLRADLKWSDGRSIVPEDFVTTVRIHQDEALNTSSRLSFVQPEGPVAATKVDARTVRFVFPAVTASAPSILAFSPYPDHVFGPAYASGGQGAVKALWPITADPATIVSSGPFRLKSHTAGQGAVLERNPFFGEWAVDASGRALPYLERLELVKVANAGDLDDRLADGTIDETSLVQGQLATVKGNANVVLRENYSAQAGNTWIVFNFNRSSDPEKERLFRSTAFRQAMSHLADRAKMIKDAYGGAGDELYTSVYPVFGDWISTSAPRFKYDAGEAKRLLGTLGYTNTNADGFLTNASGKVLEFDLITNSGNAAREALMKVFADGARAAGVKVNAQAVDFNTLTTRLASTGANRPFDAILLGLSGGSSTFPVGGVNITPCSGNLHAYNRSGACLFDWERTMETLYSQGSRDLDRARRLELGRQIQEIEGREQPFVYLAAPRQSVAWRQNVRGEYPAAIANAHNGTRELALTWKGP